MNSQINKISIDSNKIKAFIFDFDGTLVDSMKEMEKMLKEMLRERNIAPGEELIHEIKPKGFRGGAIYLKEEYKLKENENEIFEYMINWMERFYRKDINLKPGAYDLLKDLKEMGFKLALASANQRNFVDMGIKSTGINKLFDIIITTDELGTDKNSSKIFEYISKEFKLNNNEIMVVEDSAIANKKASEAGFITIGVRESLMTVEEEKELKFSSDYYIDDFSLLEII